MQRLNATVGPAADSANAETLGGEAQVSARSAVYLNGLAARSSLRRLYAGRRPAVDGEVLPVGAHLLAPRRGDTHHRTHHGKGRGVHDAGLAHAIVRAPSRLGEHGDRVTLNNGEYFCEGCPRGERLSERVERWLAWPRAIVRRIRASLRVPTTLRWRRSRAVVS